MRRRRTSSRTNGSRGSSPRTRSATPSSTKASRASRPTISSSASRRRRTTAARSSACSSSRVPPAGEPPRERLSRAGVRRERLRPTAGAPRERRAHVGPRADPSRPLRLRSPRGVPASDAHGALRLVRPHVLARLRGERARPRPRARRAGRVPRRRSDADRRRRAPLRRPPNGPLPFPTAITVDDGEAELERLPFGPLEHTREVRVPAGELRCVTVDPDRHLLLDGSRSDDRRCTARRASRATFFDRALVVAQALLGMVGP